MSTGTRVAVVTGAARGLGRATAVRLAEDGFAVAVADLSADACADTVVLHQVLHFADAPAAVIAEAARVAGPGGRLFGAVTPADVATAVQSTRGRAIDRRKVEIGNPIRSTGSYQVQVRLHPEVSATLDLEVVPES